MGATDVVTAAATQVMSMIQHGKDEGVFVATVTLPVNKTDGEVSKCRNLTRDTNMPIAIADSGAVYSSQSYG